MELPKPLFTVGYKTIRRGHYYTATGADGIEQGPFPSVTAIKGIINKGNGLMIWARREALKLANKEITEWINSGKPLTPEALAELMARADREPDKQKDDAADIGNRIHTAIDDYIMGKQPVLDEESEPGFKNFLAWIDSAGIKLFKGDTPLVAPVHGFGGRADGYGTDGGLILADWKSSKSIHDDFSVQVGGYAIATKEMYGVFPQRAIVARFGKTIPGDFEIKQVNIHNAVKAFHAALDLYKAMKQPLWIKEEK